MDSLKQYVDSNVSELKDFIASVAKRLPMPVKFTTENKCLRQKHETGGRRGWKFNHLVGKKGVGVEGWRLMQVEGDETKYCVCVLFMCVSWPFFVCVFIQHVLGQKNQLKVRNWHDHWVWGSWWKKPSCCTLSVKHRNPAKNPPFFCGVGRGGTCFLSRERRGFY